MAGKGMGAATKGGGAVEAGKKNRMMSKPSKKVPVMMACGGMAHKKTKKMNKGGMC